MTDDADDADDVDKPNERAERGRRDERDGEADDLDTYDRFMRATYRVLSEEGYSGLSMRAIAAESGMSRGLVHYYFDSKQDLVTSLLEYLIERFGAYASALSARDPRARLDALLDWIAFGPEDGEAYFLAVFELRAQAPYDEELRAILTQNYRRAVEACAEAIREGVESGVFRDVDPRRTAVLLVNAVDGARNADLTLDVTDARATVMAGLERHVVADILAD